MEKQRTQQQKEERMLFWYAVSLVGAFLTGALFTGAMSAIVILMAIYG